MAEQDTQDAAIGKVADLAKDVITEHGPRWVELTAKVQTMEHMLAESMGSSKKVEQAVMGYWNQETNKRVPGLWDDVYETKMIVAIGKKVVLGILAGVWALVGISASALVNYYVGGHQYTTPHPTPSPIVLRISTPPPAAVKP